MARQEDGRATVLRDIRSLFELGSCGDLTDGQLFERFISGTRESAEAAFTALVERHGPMVWRVCRQVLNNADQAQDAFQATFLILVKQAGSVRGKDSVGSWLHGVAHRVACCARAAELRRKKHEGNYAERQKRVSQTSRSEDAELAGLLDEELCRLPERFRAAIVLCDLEEITHDQAAVRLGWPVGTVKSRLARGRERLRSRLVRRGLAPSLGLAGVVVLRKPATAALPTLLINSTVQSAMGLGAGLVLTSQASTATTLWIREVSKTMWISKLRWAAITVLSASALGLGMSSLWRQVEARQQPQKQQVTTTHASPRSDDDAIWARHVGNLKRIGLALQNYQVAQDHYPPAAITGKDGKPLLSWRVAILPYLEDYDGRSRDDLYKAFHLEEPWDSPHNRALLERMPAVYASAGKASRQPFTTSYRGFVSQGGGANAATGGMGGMMSMMMRGRPGAMSTRMGSQMQEMMAGRMTPNLPAGGMARMMEMGRVSGGMMESGRRKGVDQRTVARNQAATEKGEVTGPMGVDMGGVAEPQVISSPVTFFRARQGINFTEITDGTNNTLMVVEAAEAVPWTKPDDLPFPQDGPLPRLGGSMQGGYAALFASGLVGYLDRSLDDRLLRCMITPQGGEIIDASQVPIPLPQPGSPPRGGLLTSQQTTELGEALRLDSDLYAGAATLENAVGILKDKLKREGKTELAGWLSEPQGRKSIRAGLQAYEFHLRRVGEPELERRQFEIIKPLYEQIAQQGAWPAGFWFSTNYRVETRNQVTYDHSEIRLNHEAMDQGKPFSFNLLILDLYSGPVEE